jgi:hypothetical protein
LVSRPGLTSRSRRTASPPLNSSVRPTKKCYRHVQSRRRSFTN